MDTNVLLDVVGADEAFGLRSRDVLAHCAETGTLVLNPIVYAEVSTFIDSIEGLDALLPTELFRREPVPWTASFIAGKAYQRYKQRDGKKRRMLADFLIGAHAAAMGYGLISRDEGYRSYFDLEIVNPATASDSA